MRPRAVAVLVIACLIACREPAAPAPVAVPVADPVAAPVAVVDASAQPVVAPDAAPDDADVAGTEPAHLLRGTEQSPTTLTLGDRVTFGAWDVRWIARWGGRVRLEARRNGKPVGAWNALDGAPHDLETPNRLFTFQVQLVEHTEARIVITARESDLTTAAKYGQALPMGTYRFPDGLRLRFGRGDGCDFDVSDPCPFGTWYGASAALGDREEGMGVRKRRVKILGRTLEVVAEGTFVLRK